MPNDYTYSTRLYFEDECPRIGAGWRTVSVDDDIDVTRLTDPMGRTCRLATKDFDRLVEKTEELLSRCKA